LSEGGKAKHYQTVRTIARTTGLERGGNKPFEAPGQCTHTRKGSIGTARRRCIY
jgi:hypothetical protein